MPESSEPLQCPRHEAFAKTVAGGSSAAAAYLGLFKCSKATAETNGPKLARDTQVRLRLEWLKRQAVEKAKEETGRWVKSKAEWIAWLSESVLTPVGDIDGSSPFAQEVTRDYLGEETAKQLIRKKVKAVGKLEALKLIGSWQQFETGTEADNHSAAAQRALVDAVRSLTHGRKRTAS
jgi:hypothetical protein